MDKHIRQWYLAPLYLIIALPLLIEAIQRHNYRHLLAYLFSIIIILSVRAVFNIKPFNFVIFSLPLLFLAINYDVLAIEYKSHINVTSWNTLFNTNQSEASDFISGTRYYTKLLALFQILVFFYYLKFTWKKNIKITSGKVRYGVIAMLVIFSIDYAVKGATRIAFPVRGIAGLTEYINTKITESKYLEIKKHAKLNALRNKDFNSDNNETIIIVVGESLRRDHLGYYDYKRPTTPYLDKENLIVFTDVISPANQTINSLKRIFTPAEFLNENDYWKSPSLIKAFKEVGFTTYWVTTQAVYGKHQAQVSFIGEEADYFIGKYQKKYGYDENMLDTVKNILQEKHQKKLIFLHIMGNHTAYDKRYPKEFEYFSKVSNQRKKLINMYDNAVRYNDYFLHQVISSLKKIPGEKSFIMFSDHGESLFDTPNYAYHGSAEPSKSEYNIPLVLWFSNEFKSQHPITIQQVISNKNKPVILSDAFHAFPDLFGISFTKQISENNFFSNTYQPKSQRKVVNLNLELLDYKQLPSGVKK